MSKKYGCTIENFIRDTESKYSICREERQYALFLYNILRYYGKPERRNADKKEGEMARNLFDACRIPEDAAVIHVFYEATFMRDFFERNRRLALGADEKRGRWDFLLQKSFSRKKKLVDQDASFNYKLMKFVCQKSGVPVPKVRVEEKNWGRDKVPMKEKEAFMVRCMMEAKPDIAVVYQEEKNGKAEKRLLFLECKFSFSEAHYRSRDEVKFGFSQCEIHGKIAEFLCEYILNEDSKDEKIKVSESMKCEQEDGGYRSCIVRFVRSKGENSREQRNCSKQEDGSIAIGDLIALNNRILS